MLRDTHRTQVLEAMPQAKAAAKKANTKLGIVLVALGVLAALSAFVLARDLVQSGNAFDKWSLLVMALPLGVGLFLCVLGATVWSGELVRAGLKDMAAAVRSVWRRNGSGS